LEQSWRERERERARERERERERVRIYILEGKVARGLSLRECRVAKKKKKKIILALNSI
jgi:hypothetical protein